MFDSETIDHYIRMSEEVFLPIYPHLCRSVQSRTGVAFDDLKVVDLGGGSGLWLEALLDLGADHGVLIDAAPAMIEYARTRLAGKFSSERFVAAPGSADAIPLPDSAFNLIISRSSMHMWKNLQTCWQEMCRILEPGGYAFLGRGYGPDLPLEIRDQVKEARRSLRKSESRDSHEEPPSPDPFEVARLAFTAGFSEVSLIKDQRAVWILAMKAVCA